MLLNSKKDDEKQKLLYEENLSDRTPILDILIEKWKVYNKYKKAPNQKWNFHNIKDKKIMIENSATKKCIDISKKAKAGNGYIINDCLKGNEGEHFRFQTAIGKVIKAKKISPKKKAKILKKKFSIICT